jgi:hypothetical protein
MFHSICKDALSSVEALHVVSIEVSDQSFEADLETNIDRASDGQ